MALITEIANGINHLQQQGNKIEKIIVSSSGYIKLRDEENITFIGDIETVYGLPLIIDHITNEFQIMSYKSIWNQEYFAHLIPETLKDLIER